MVITVAIFDYATPGVEVKENDYQGSQRRFGIVQPATYTPPVALPGRMLNGKLPAPGTLARLAARGAALLVAGRGGHQATRRCRRNQESAAGRGTPDCAIIAGEWRLRSDRKGGWPGLQRLWSY